MRSELKKNIFHLAWSPDSLPASQAAAPLLDSLDQILLDLEPNLLPDAFHRCVAAIWDVLLVELWAQAEVSSGVSLLRRCERERESLFPIYLLVLFSERIVIFSLSTSVPRSRRCIAVVVYIFTWPFVYFLVCCNFRLSSLRFPSWFVSFAGQVLQVLRSLARRSPDVCQFPSRRW